MADEVSSQLTAALRLSYEDAQPVAWGNLAGAVNAAIPAIDALESDNDRLRAALIEAADALDHASRHADGWVAVAYEKARDKALEAATPVEEIARG